MNSEYVYLDALIRLNSYDRPVRCVRRELTRVSCQGTLFPPSRIPNVFSPNKVVGQSPGGIWRVRLEVGKGKKT